MIPKDSISGFISRRGKAIAHTAMTTASAHAAILAVIALLCPINNKVYAVESPDALTPEKSAAAVMKYSQNNTNAAIVFDSGIYRTFVCGFPFETIVDEENRNLLMHKVLDFLDKK